MKRYKLKSASLLATDELDTAIPERTVRFGVVSCVKHSGPSDDAGVLRQRDGDGVFAVIGRGGMGAVLRAFDHELVILRQLIATILISLLLTEQSSGQINQNPQLEDHPAIARAIVALGPQNTATGTIRDEKGSPIEGATIWVIGDPFDETICPLSPPRLLEEGVSDENGNFSIAFQRLELASHTLLISKSGFSSIRKIIVPELGAQRLELKLLPERKTKGVLAGPVGVETSNVIVQVRGYECDGSNFDLPINIDPSRLDQLGLRTVSNSRGEFQLSGLPAGCKEVQLTVDDPRFAPLNYARYSGETIRANDGVCLIKRPGDGANQPQIEVQLSRPRWVSGIIRAKSNAEPIANAWVGVVVMEQEQRGDTHPMAIWGKTDKQGRYRVRVGPWGSNVSVYVFPPRGVAVPDCLFFERNFPINDNELELDCDMPEGVLIKGRVIDRSTRQAIAGVSIISMLNRELASNISEEAAYGIYWANEYHRRYTDSEGYFAQPVAKGELTHLMLRSPRGNYVSSFISAGSMMTKSGQDGGHWYAVEAHRRLTPEESKASLDIEVELTPGVNVQGVVKTSSNAPATKCIVFRDRPLHTQDNQATGLVLWGWPAFDGRFAVAGCHPAEITQLHFLDADKGEGAILKFDPSIQDNEKREVTLQACGSAKVQLLNSDNSPLKNTQLNGKLICEVAIVFRETSIQSEIASSYWNYQLATHQIDPVHNANLMTDKDGSVTFPNLIPGAKYRLIFRENGGVQRNSPAFEREFVVRPGESLDLGQVKIPTTTKE